MNVCMDGWMVHAPSRILSGAGGVDFLGLGYLLIISVKPGGLEKGLGVVCACDFGCFYWRGRGVEGWIAVCAGWGWGYRKVINLLLGGAKWGNDR